jgi:hypothetical protein
MIAQSRSLRRLRLAALTLCLAVSQVHADAGWFASGDTQLRLDLQVLNDAEIIRLPVNQWPLPRAAVAYALANAKDHFATNSAVSAALARVRARLEEAARSGAVFDTGVRGGEPGLWRDFDTLAREDGELGAGLSYSSGRFATDLEVTAVTDPADGQEIRLDGSHATVQFGNWLLSANALDRWWGPGHEGSLILSNNARPMPTFMVERAEARPWEPAWLNWLGPWRMNFGISQMEESRQDIDSPLFMAWRFTIMPFKKIEFGFSRTAQFCGEQQECSLGVFGDLLIGNDNVGLDVSAEEEPGNQMAGFDMRWNSPLGNLPYAFYGQYIGEDESSFMPAKYLEQFGGEIWHAFPDGSLAQAYLEWSSTTCTGHSRFGQRWGCAYNQGQFNIEGYRYRDRNIGYTADRDSRNWALGANYTETDGNLWTATARYSDLARGSTGDPNNTVAAVPTQYAALEFGWKGRFFGEHLSVDLGVEGIEPEGAERDVHVFGFVGWRHEFQP